MAKKPMGKKIDVFYAYPSEPPSVNESISQALLELKASPTIRDDNVRFKPWPSMSIGGKSVVGVVTENIDRAEVFACDLTHPNFNVTFELGYAVGKFKRVWLSLNTVVENAPREYKRTYYNLLGGLGYEPYENHKDLVNALISKPPWADLNATALGDVHRNQAARQEYPTLVYVKPPFDTDAVIATAEALQKSTFGESLVVDDPKEDASPTLEWYTGKIRTADAILVHLSATDHRDATNHNLKCSFVAGLAYGFGKPLLMVAHSPFDPPMDYQLLLKIHQTAQQCEGIVKRWIGDLEPHLPRRRPRRSETTTPRSKALDLRKLSIGDHIAEHEQRGLDNYFVETSAYYRALDSQTTIVVGRKGTGKTANLYAMRTALSHDKRNHVCVIIPVGYEIDGIVRVLNENLDRSERGYLVQSFWKLLVFSELAYSVFEEISSRPVHRLPTEDEQRFLDYVTSRRDVLFIPLSERLDKAVKSLIGVGDLPGAIEQRARISELLHSHDLLQLRELLGLVLSNRHKVAILIDNLDKPWGPGQHIQRLSELLLGLLRVAGDVSDDFQHQDHWRKRVNVSVTVFLRSDIFAFIQPLAAEQDKLPIQRMVWDDPKLLLRVLSQRIEYAAPVGYDAETVLSQFFPKEVVGVPTSEFITRTVLPRPRDVIYLVQQAIDGAVNRGHPVVTVEDFLDARKNYSEFVFKSILAEDDPSKGKLEAVLYEFAGAPKVLKFSDVHVRIARAGVEDSELEFYVDLLCDLNFFGIQTAQGFRYASDEGDRQMMRQVAKRLAVDRAWGEESYEVNAAFHQVLQIE